MGRPIQAAQTPGSFSGYGNHLSYVSRLLSYTEKLPLIFGAQRLARARRAGSKAQRILLGSMYRVNPMSVTTPPSTVTFITCLYFMPWRPRKYVRSYDPSS